MSTTEPSAFTLVDLLTQQADRHDEKPAFLFCPEGDEEHDRLTYRELDRRARAVAAGLQQHGAAGQRVLIFCRPGLDSIVAFFGCLYARAVAIPVDAQWTSARIEAIVPDARAEIALATLKTQDGIRAAADRAAEAAGLSPLQWFATEELSGDEAAADRWALPPVTAATIAAIQYTSGTTKAPKGVVLTHGNFMHNLETVRQTWAPAPDNPVFHRPVGSVTWLPQYHDLGLIGGVLMTLYVGTTTVVMSPGAFLMRPMRWLEAMSRHGAVISGAPNFAYDWCVKRSTATERAALDLSNWQVALNGGEPVNPASLQAFSEAFAPAGFAPETFLPVYGLAEATLGVSGGSDSPLPVVVHVDRGALGEDRVVEAAPDDPVAAAVVGCGRPRGGQRVIIVDPETRIECDADGVGEIWVSGPSVGQGYWRRGAETEQTFAAYLADAGQAFRGPFLRTGDRGFLRDGELFVTGRCKDLIVLGDVVHYPNDIERTVQDSNAVLLAGRGAVFAITGERGDPFACERLVVVQEVQRHRMPDTDIDGVLAAIRDAVRRHHRTEVHDVLLVKPMSIPTTSSGKIQRAACREKFSAGELTAVAQWNAPPPPAAEPGMAAKQQMALGLARFVGRLARQRRDAD
ncbi:fatty-acid--CoA ligase [Mycolicibacter heraklionensis]|uniref:Fatty-acid--CoA ligase n=1 Tax=Mycolicibacter heraklionensis TaxID=512402 RepID=A0AA91IZH5_9MYCO|nr:fatty acyl-AMP ligase [Mycolicibacter heraklionensis]OBK88747.1 fatty-acid--CoA ligase [Mycolicibacter heraklionensis]